MLQLRIVTIKTYKIINDNIGTTKRINIARIKARNFAEQLPITQIVQVINADGYVIFEKLGELDIID